MLLSISSYCEQTIMRIYIDGEPISGANPAAAIHVINKLNTKHEVRNIVKIENACYFDSFVVLFTH